MELRATTEIVVVGQVMDTNEINASNDSVQTLNEINRDNLAHLIKKFKVCGEIGMNKVYPRHDNINHVYELYRNWSMLSETMSTFMGLSKTPRPYCRNIGEVLVASMENVDHQNCLIPLYDSDSICNIMNRYRHIYFDGDSLVRHMVVALKMLLSENLRYGGVESLSFSEPQYEHCNCDGQFSEDLDCRTNINLNSNFSPSDGYCVNIANIKSGFSYDDGRNQYRNMSFLCNSKDRRPIFITFGHGVHFQFDSTAYLDMFLRPRLENLYKYATSLCPRELSVNDFKVAIWGGSASSPLLVKRYPNQAHEKIVKFNKNVHDFIKHNYRNYPITYIDILNLTMEAATNHSSDGQHFLSDVNVMKNMILVNVMKYHSGGM